MQTIIVKKIFGVFLTLPVFILLLTACDRGGGGGVTFGLLYNKPLESVASSSALSIPSPNSIRLAWKNPVITDTILEIERFEIEWVLESDSNNKGNGIKTNETASGIDASYEIRGLMTNVTYRVFLMTVYNLGPSNRTEFLIHTGENRDSDPFTDARDNCPTDYSLTQIDTDNDGEGNVCDEDDDNDGVPDDEDAFILNRCAAKDTDRDGMPDALLNSCSAADANLILDLDDDNDGVNDTRADRTPLDNCRLVANFEQTDSDGDGIGDACEDADHDQDGFADARDNCPVDFNPRQQDTDGDGIGDVCDRGDLDGDGIADVLDSDRDNDSLIEIWTLEDLAGLRDDLNGDGADDHRFDDATDNVTPRGDGGCPAAGCIGYELGRSLDFTEVTSYANATANMAAWTSGSGWIPIGFCTVRDTCAATSSPSFYSSVFEGNGHTISNLFVHAEALQIGAGLFGAASGEMRNLRIMDAEIRNGLSAVGILAGYARAARVDNVSVQGSVFGTRNSVSVGGLLGDAQNAVVRFSSAAAGSVHGGDAVGGLIGDGRNAQINFSFSDLTLINGADRVGGLVGDGRGAAMINASAFNGPVQGESMVGGLVGDGRGAAMINASAFNGPVQGESMVGGLVGDAGLSVVATSFSSGSVFGTRNSVSVGGLLGDAQNAVVRFSSAAAGSVRGGDAVGGLIGDGRNAQINFSFSDLTLINGVDRVGGLVGDGRGAAMINASAFNGPVQGESMVGGLVGDGRGAVMIAASAFNGPVQGESMVGGLVGDAGLSVVATSFSSGSVFGTRNSVSVGGLLGDAQNAVVRFSSAAAGSVRGGDAVGGLIGDGRNAQINFSFSDLTLINGVDRVGGLVGDGRGAVMIAASAFNGPVQGESMVGGLVGDAGLSVVAASFSSGAAVSGQSAVGGLAGDAAAAELIATYARRESVSGDVSVGGLLGNAPRVQVRRSYVAGGLVSGDRLAGGLIGFGDAAMIIGSYWNNQTTGQNESSGGGLGRTGEDLQTAQIGSGIYADWDSVWCDAPAGIFTTDASHAIARAENIAWRAGEAHRYPYLNCIPDARAVQYFSAAESVRDLEGIPANNRVRLSWQNPGGEIELFDITWQTSGFRGNFVKRTERASNDFASYEIENLDNGRNYTISVVVVAADGRSYAAEIVRRPGFNGDDDSLPDSLDPDDDNDNFPDQSDVDDNNDGLIEIHTLDDLARLRDDLDGDGTDDGNIGEVTAIGSAGCPSSGCLGYELTRSLNFSDADSYAEGSGNPAIWADRSGSGWVPIGSCIDNIVNNICTAYAGVFDGRGYVIADLFVSADNTANGIGLFGAFAGRIQNLHLLNVHVSGGLHDVGGLVGHGRSGRYENLSVTGGGVLSMRAAGVGGLVGDARSADIRYVNVSGVDVSGGKDDVGGLAGFGRSADIRYAYVSGGSIFGEDDVGGLVGDGQDADIRYVYVLEADVSARFNVGGLVGLGQGVDIRHAYMSGGSVIGTRTGVGGLVGDGQGADIRYAYVATGPVSGADDVGGLLGISSGSSSSGRTAVTVSYWDTQTTGRPTSADDLGTGRGTTELQSPTGFTGIYALWGNFWCNPNTGEESTTDLGAPFVRVWDLGTGSQYPALRCIPGGLSAQGR